MIRTRTGSLLFAALLLVFAVVLGITVGGVHLSFADLVSGEGPAGRTARLLASLRCPRVALAAIVGGCLALAGAALQALLKNPLADPFLLGTSGGAATGAAIAALAGFSPLLSPAAAFTGAVVSSFGVAALARRGGRLDLQRLLLAGLIAQCLLLRADPARLLGRVGRGGADDAVLDDGKPGRRDARKGARPSPLRGRRGRRAHPLRGAAEPLRGGGGERRRARRGHGGDPSASSSSRLRS